MSLCKRLIARLDIKGNRLIKGIRFEGLRVIGDPLQHARAYASMGIDEILFIDSVASLYGRNSLTDILRSTSRDVFVPITAGGGVRSVQDAAALLAAGADKIAVNTAAVLNPNLISEISTNFGNQCMVLSVEAKRSRNLNWEVYINNGREHTGLSVIEWIKKGVDLGAGEIFLTSVDNEGTRKGFDLELIKTVSNEVNVPIIASGGMGCFEDFEKVINYAKADAIAMSGVLHYKRLSISEIRKYALDNNFNVRVYD